MKAAIAPLTCLILGIVLGISISNKHRVETPAPTEKTHTPLGSAIPASSPQKPPQTPAVTRPSLTNLANDDQKLIDLALRASSSSSRMLDFERAAQHLTADQLFALADKGEQLPVPYSTLRWARTNLLARAARLDPDAAIARASAIADRSSRWSATKAVYVGIAQHDARVAAAKLADVRDARQFRDIFNAILSSGAEDAPAAMFELLTQRDEPLTKFKVGSLGAATTRENLEQSLQLLDRLPSDNQKRAFLSSAVSSLAKTDPQTALTLLESHGDGEKNRPVFLGAIGRSWLLADPQNARAWISSLPDPADRAGALTEMTTTSGEHRHWLLGQLADLPQDEGYTIKLSQSLAHEWGMRAPEEALRWISQLQPSETREAVARASTTSYARDWASLDPEAATDWVETLSAEDPVRHKMVDAFVLEWASSDFENARQWSAQLPDETSRHTAINALVSSTIASDFQLAAEIYNNATLGLTAEQSEPFARSTTDIAKACAKQDPSAAFTWAEALANEKQKFLSLEIAVNQWRRTDPETAREAVEAADIDSDSRSRLLKRLPQSRP